jgi:hypothetical protein
VVNECCLYELFLFSRIAKKVHRIGNAAVHMVAIPLKVSANQASIWCEQLFNSRTLKFYCDLNQARSAFSNDRHG